jgi:hypothetical protein
MKDGKPTIGEKSGEKYSLREYVCKRFKPEFDKKVFKLNKDFIQSIDDVKND